MLIINADDWGGWKSATDAALSCFEAKRITSATAMVFMEDSERAAGIARATGFEIGLHLNFNHEFTGTNCPPEIRAAHDRVRRYLRKNKYTQLIYNPFLKRDFRTAFDAQLQEFHRIYGRSPTHFDGHQHMHLCANALWDELIPSGEFVRRSFSFQQGEKSWFNRTYRSLIDRKLLRKYRLTDAFYSLEQCLQKNSINRVVESAAMEVIEIMTHPEKSAEQKFLMDDGWDALLKRVQTSTYSQFRQKSGSSYDQN